MNKNNPTCLTQLHRFEVNPLPFSPLAAEEAYGSFPVSVARGLLKV